MTEVIADYPTYRILKMNDWQRTRIRHGQKFAIMFPSRTHGDLPHFFTFGSVFGSAVCNGDDPLKSYHRAMTNGHKIRWANANAVVIHNGPKVKEDAYCLAFGDVIKFEGTSYRLEKAPNDNVALVEI